MTPSRSSSVRAALAGVLAAAAGLAVGELVAAPVRGWLSPVVAIADRVVDAVPQPVKQFAIDVFGLADKIALVTGIMVVLALAAAAIGLLARARRGVALVLTALVGVAGVVASLADPALGPLAALPSAAGGAAAVATLAWLTRASTGAGGARGRAHDASRRVVLTELGGVALGAAALGGGGRLWARARAVAAEQSRETTALPAPVATVDVPEDVSLDVAGVTPWRTANADFYRIDTQIGVPSLSREGWTLRVVGQVDRELELTLDELEREFEVVERAITMTCVSNEVGGDLVGNATWRGVRVADVLDAAGVEDAATQLVGRAFDDFTTGYPVAHAYDRDALLAVGMNGVPLPAAHGFPLRMVVPGLYGYVSATKWLTELELTTFEAFDQYWVERGWAEEAPIRMSSRIDTPAGLERLPRGEVAVAGVAWAQPTGVDRVEVRIDGGQWRETELGASFDDVTWRQWVLRWDTTTVEPGRHTLQVRAVDRSGEVQVQERAEPFPRGATGWHQIVVMVE